MKKLQNLKIILLSIFCLVFPSLSIATFAKNMELEKENASKDLNLDKRLYAPLAGTYTIGGINPDYATFTAAANALNTMGVNGPALFNVRPGTYTEQVTIPNITGASGTNTITFQSENGDSTSVKITQAEFDNLHTLGFDGAEYVTFHQLTIESTSQSLLSHVVAFQNGAGNNTLSNSVIEVNSSISSDGIHGYFGLGDNNHLLNNRILNGENGISFIYNPETGLEIRGNLLENQSRYSIDLNNCDAPIVEGNTIISNSTSGNFVGIYANLCTSTTKIVKNNIQGDRGVGIYLKSNNSTDTERAFVANNFIHFSGTNSSLGIYLFQGSYVNVYHNSVHIANTSSSATALYDAGSDNRVLNNNLVVTGQGKAIFINSTRDIDICDYNNLYTNGAILATYFNGFSVYDAANLTDWQNNSLFDDHSYSIDPQFFSSSDLHITNPTLDSAATPNTGVLYDFDMELRDPTFPDIGADEICLADTILTAIKDTICQGDFLVFNEMNLTMPGTYHDTTTNSNGCVNLIELMLQVSDTSHFEYEDTICQDDFFIFNNLILTESGTYRDTMTNIAGCDSFIVLSLTVNPNPTLTATDVNVNVGDPIILMASTVPNGVYSWSGPNNYSAIGQMPLVTNSAVLADGGIYTVTVTDENDCTATASATVTVKSCLICDANESIVAVPNFMPGTIDHILPGCYISRRYLTSDGTVQTGDTVSFKAGIDIVLEPGFTVQQGGVFTAQIEVCSPAFVENETNKILKRETPLKVVHPLEYGIIVKIRPNPFAEQAILELDIPQDQQVAIGLYDHFGRLVQQIYKPKLLEEGQHQFIIQATKLTAGQYYVVLNTANEQQVLKVIIIKNGGHFGNDDGDG